MPLPGGVITSFSAQQISYSGPIPPPKFLREYDEIVPGAAERILAMAEAQTTHRIQIEKRAVESGITRANWGLVSGTVIGVLAIGLGGAAMLMGQPTAGFWFGVIGMTGLVGVFVTGRYMTGKEREQKNRDMKRR